MRLTKQLKKLIDEFQEAAETNGWERDQGSNEQQVKDAEVKMMLKKKRLYNYLRRIKTAKA